MVTIAVSVLISTVVSFLISFMLRAVIEDKYREAKAETANRKENQKQYAKLQRKWQHAVGRVLYHLVRNVQGFKINGDLDSCYAKLEEVEAEQKDIEQEQLVDIE